MSGRDSYHHGDLRAELLRLGLAAIETEGADALSLRSLSELAGVSKTAPYRHFPTREAFLAALADEGYRLLFETLRKAGGEHGAGLPEMGQAYLAFALERPGLYRLMMSPLVCEFEGVQNQDTTERRSESASAEPGWPQRALIFLAEGLARDSARRGGSPDISPDAAAAAWAYIHGLVLIRIDGLFPAEFGEPDWDALARFVPILLP